MNNFLLNLMLAGHGIHPVQESGRVVKRAKGAVTHTGIILGRDDRGRVMIVHHGQERGSEITPLEVFSKGEAVQFLEGATFSQEVVVQRALELWKQQKPYDVLNWNCQHFTSFAATGKTDSFDVRNWGLAAIFVSGVFLYQAFRDRDSGESKFR